MQELRTSCPFHTPSDDDMSIDLDTGRFKCHICEKSGQIEITKDKFTKRKTLHFEEDKPQQP